MVAPTGRPMRQRTTTYENPDPERIAAAGASDGVCAAVRGPRTPLPLVQAQLARSRVPAVAPVRPQPVSAGPA